MMTERSQQFSSNPSNESSSFGYGFVVATLIVFGLTIKVVGAKESPNYSFQDGKCSHLIKNKVGECGKILKGTFDLMRLTGTNLRGAVLSQSSFRLSDLHRADLRGADLRGAQLEGTNLALIKEDEHTRWRGAKIDEYSILPKAWGKDHDERKKMAFKLGIRFVQPPYKFYHSNEEARLNIRAKMKLVQSRALSNNVESKSAIEQPVTVAKEEDLSADSTAIVEEDFFN